jgi:hypothetical protein
MKWLIYLLGVAFLLTGCTTNGGALQEPPDLEGLIYDKQEKTILVVEGIEDISISEEEWQGKSAIVFSVTNKTEITLENGEKVEFDALEKGQRVKVWHTGHVLESYPAQAEARKIIVLD